MRAWTRRIPGEDPKYDKAKAKQSAKLVALRLAGGAEYEEYKKRNRERKKKQRELYGNGNRQKEYDKRRCRTKKLNQNWRKSKLVAAAKKRGKQQGLETTISTRDLGWPTHCPILGIELNYMGRQRPDMPRDAAASLDRWDNAKGYIPGNVFVISLRANALKSNATAAELYKVAQYAADYPGDLW
jgi:hypothetical protein